MDGARVEGAAGSDDEAGGGRRGESDGQVFDRVGTEVEIRERRAVALLARLEKYTGELQTLDRSVIELTRQFEQK